MAWVAVVVTVAGAAAAAYGSHKAGKAQDAMAKHNAKVAEQEALARQHAIASESRKLTKSQRNLQAKQRKTAIDGSNHRVSDSFQPEADIP